MNLLMTHEEYEKLGFNFDEERQIYILRFSCYTVEFKRRQALGLTVNRLLQILIDAHTKERKLLTRILRRRLIDHITHDPNTTNFEDELAKREQRNV